MIKISYTKELSKEKEIATVKIIEGKDSATLLREDGRKELHLAIGEKKDFSRRKLAIVARRVIRRAKVANVKRVAINFEEFEKLTDTKGKELAELIAKNFELANFSFVEYKTKPEEGWRFIEEIIFLGKTNISVKQGVETGQIIAKEINACRTLANTPGGDVTPRVLAKAAEDAAKGTKVKVTVLGKTEIKKLKMGGILGVAKGSKEEPKFIVMEYKGKAEEPTVLVGKGVTFDTGGLDLKPSPHMLEMHMDMSGGAAAIHAIVAAAKLGIKKHIVAIIPAVENMPSGESFRPGDILKTMSGKTIEVLNTDAEGRIIIADALTYAKKFKPKTVIDMATLTGAATVALGKYASALFSKDDKLAEKLTDAGEQAGDYVWRLPLWDEYEVDIRGSFGDWANAGKSRYGGAITAAVFLYQFARDLECPWAHIDMAPRMTSTQGDYLSKGAAGAPVGLLINYLRK